MLELGIAFVAGLVIGWTIFPQPAWLVSVWTSITGLFKKAA